MPPHLLPRGRPMNSAILMDLTHKVPAMPIRAVAALYFASRRSPSRAASDAVRELGRDGLVSVYPMMVHEAAARPPVPIYCSSPDDLEPAPSFAPLAYFFRHRW